MGSDDVDYLLLESHFSLLDLILLYDVPTLVSKIGETCKKQRKFNFILITVSRTEYPKRQNIHITPREPFDISLHMCTR